MLQKMFIFAENGAILLKESVQCHFMVLIIIKEDNINVSTPTVNALSALLFFPHL